MRIRFWPATTLLVLLAACTTPPAELEYARAAAARADAWLAQVDAGDIGGSWDSAARLFQNRISKAEWQARAGRVQPSLGKLMGRELVAAKYTSTRPWEVPGEHVIVQYRAFYDSGSVLETLTMRRDDDQWKTIGYVIRKE